MPLDNMQENMAAGATVAGIGLGEVLTQAGEAWSFNGEEPSLPVTITNSSGGIAGSSISAQVGVQILPIVPNIALAGLTNADVLTSFTPGFAFKILKIEAQVIVAATTAAKAATLTTKIGSTATTGGILALTSANMTPKGVVTASSAAITGANTGTSTDTITITASSVTAFVEGSASIVMHLQNLETANAIVTVMSILGTKGGVIVA